jgi:hypothetical protein
MGYGYTYRDDTFEALGALRAGVLNDHTVEWELRMELRLAFDQRARELNYA